MTTPNFSLICEYFPDCGDIQDLETGIGLCKHCYEEDLYENYDIDHEMELNDLDYDLTSYLSETEEIPLIEEIEAEQKALDEMEAGIYICETAYEEDSDYYGGF